MTITFKSKTFFSNFRGVHFLEVWQSVEKTINIMHK